MPVGNCLMGHVDGPNAMALAFMNSGGVNQMFGYTVPTWYGYAGWGCLDYFIQQPGRYTFAEAFFANQAALIHRLQKYFPALVKAEPQDGRMRTQEPGQDAIRDGLTAKDGAGLLYDRDNVAFYGDPAWEARMADHEKDWEQKLACKDGVYTFEVSPKRADAAVDPVRLNGSQRNVRPIVEFLPHRVRDVKVLQGAELEPVITDNLLVMPNPCGSGKGGSYVVKFAATRMQ